MRITTKIFKPNIQYRVNQSSVKSSLQKYSVTDGLSSSNNSINKASTLILSNQALEHLQKSQKKTNTSQKTEKDSMKTLEKCLEIARRIMCGDHVPYQDENFLREHNLELYQLAINMRIIKDKPKEWDSILEEQDEPNMNTEIVTSISPDDID